MICVVVIVVVGYFRQLTIKSKNKKRETVNKAKGEERQKKVAVHEHVSDEAHFKENITWNMYIHATRTCDVFELYVSCVQVQRVVLGKGKKKGKEESRRTRSI